MIEKVKKMMPLYVSLFVEKFLKPHLEMHIYKGLFW